MSHRLTPDEKERLERDGFVVREAVFGQDEVRELGDASEALVARLLAEPSRLPRMAMGSYVFELAPRHETVLKWEKDAADILLGLEPFAHLDERLLRCALDPRLVDPSEELVGTAPVELYTEKLNLKRARSGGPIVLHQDYPYWRDVADEPERIATAIVFLDDSRRETGCVEVVPGSHRGGPRPGKAETGFGSFEMDEAAWGDALVPVEVAAGAVVWFGPMLVHRSAHNLSDRDRRALLFSYQPPGLRHARQLVPGLAPRTASGR